MKRNVGVIASFLFFVVSMGSAAAATMYYSGWPSSSSMIYRIDSTTGNDLLLMTIPNVGYNDLAASLITNTIYAIDISASTGCLHTVNVIALADQLIGCAGIGIRQLGYDGNNNILYGTNNSSLYSINTSTGAATLIGSFGGPTSMKALTYDGGTNTLYGVDDITLSLYTINTSTGAATLVGSTGGTSPNIYDIYVDPGTGQMFGIGASAAGSTASFFSLNKTTGAATLVRAGTIDFGLGLAEPLVVVAPVPTPTLSDFGKVLLITLFLALGMWQLRRRIG